MNDPAAEENEEDQNYTAECFVLRDAIARSKDDEIARHRDMLHDKVGAAVAERIAGKGSHLVAIVDTAWQDNDLLALGLRTKAYITSITRALETACKQRQQLKDADAALAAAAEQLRAVMEANEILRKQLSDQTHELGVLEGKAEMWQQRAEIAEAQLTRNAAMEAVLRECRQYVSHRHMMIEDDAERRAAYACLESIDQLTAKGAE